MAQRRLAAIMFTDIVGYDSFLKEDEKKAFKILRKNQRIHRRLIKKFNGRWLKEMESGTLASFHSNIDAVMCAVSIQKATEELNIPVRIGIHQGDVIFEKKDVLGDGVNIASRIQCIASAVEIVISEKVYSDIANKEGLETEFLGEHTLKGVSKPVGIYKISCSDENILDFTIDTGELVRPLRFGRSAIFIGIMVIAMLAFAFYYFLPKIINPPSEKDLSVLILPFNNYLGTDTLDYFIAGMHDALISDIGQVSALNVKSKTTASSYKNSNKSIPEIADELGVNTFVEGAVLCIEDSICYQAKMFDREERVLWTRDYKVERSQILSLYRKVTKDIASEIGTILTPQEKVLMAVESRIVDPIAYDLYMKGQVYNDQITRDGLEKAAQFFKLAIERDPDWAPPYTRMASNVARHYQFGFIERSVAMTKQPEYYNKALELDPNSSDAYNQKAGTAAWVEWNWEKAESAFLESIRLNPNYSSSQNFYAHLLMILRRTDEALHYAKKATELDPLNPVTLALSVGVLVSAGDCEAALSQVEKALRIEPDHPHAIRQIILVSECLGDYEKAFEIMKQMNIVLWEEYKLTATFEKIFHEQGWIAFLEELIKVNEEVFAEDKRLSDNYLANICFRIKNYEKALDYYEKAFESHSPGLPYFSCKPIYDELKDNPRYIALLKKMNLPVDQI
jgi:tetratricopeptide (TPR) repeat protein/TolB-like protein